MIPFAVMRVEALPKVCIVIINYNGRALLEKHLPSVLNTEYPNFEVVVVDNASTDGSLDLLRKEFPSVRVIKNIENLGFGRANNVAFTKLKGFTFFALLNNDMEVTPAWLDRLVEKMKNNLKVAAVGPRVLYSTMRGGRYIINSAGGVVDEFDRGFDRFEGCPDNDTYETVEEVDFISGGAMLLRKEAMDEVGGFDERMFFYYEDVDLCLRFKEKGWKIMYNGMAVVYHDHQATAKNWGQRKMTLAANVNRIKSIWRRRGMIPAILECVRAPLEWAVYTLYGKITGKTYREMLLRGKYTCRA